MKNSARFLPAAISLAVTASFLTPQIGLSQTPGIVTDGLEANHDTDPDAGSNAAWENVGGNAAGVDRQVGFSAIYNDSPFTLHQNLGGSYDLQGGNTNANRSFRLGAAFPDSYGEVLGNPVTQQDASFEIWFKPPTFDTAANNNDGNMRNRILWETGGGTGTGLVINGSNLYFASRSGGQQAIATVDLSALGIGPDEFVQAVGVVRTQGNDGVDLYINGQLAQTTPIANLSDWDGGDGDAIGGRGANNLGGFGNGFGALDPDGGGPASAPGGEGWRSFGGEIGIFRFYSNALDASQVAQNFAAVTGDRAFSAAAGEWGVGGSWEGGTTPAATGVTAFVGGGHNISIPNGGAAVEVETLAIGHQSGSNAGTGTVTVAGSLTAGTIAVGGSGAPGTNNNLNINSGGTVNITGDLVFGLASDQGGNVRLNNGGSLTVAGSIIERTPGVNTAQFYHNGGTLVVGGDISAQSFRTGDAVGSTAAYTQPAGQTITNTGTFFAGNNGVGTHTVDGGTVLVDNSIRVAEQAGGAGSSLILDSGTVHNRGGNNVGNTNKQLDIGRRGDGTVVVNGGTFTNDATIRFGNGAATTAALTISGGTFVQNGNINTGAGTSTLAVDGGTLDLIDNANQRSVTNFSQSAGNVIFRVRDTIAGPQALAATDVTLTGGTITPTPDLAPSVSDGSFGTWTGPGGSIAAPASGDWEDDLNWETSTGSQLRPGIGGGTLEAGANFTLITYGTLSGTPTSGDPQWNVADDAAGNINATYNGPTVGSAMPATVAGAVTVTRDSQLHIAPNTFGVDATQLTVDGATLELTDGSGLDIGGSGNIDANVNLNNGATATIPGNITFGPAGAQRGGILNINSGSTLNVGGDIIETAPSIPNAQLQINNGTLNMSNNGSIVVQRFSVGEVAGSNATYTAQGDITTTGTFNIAGAGDAVGNFTVNDPSHTVTAANLSVAQGLGNNGSDTSNGTFDLTQGALNVNAGNFNIAGDNQADTGVTATFTQGNGTSNPSVTVAGGNSEWGHGGTAVIEINSGTYAQNSNNIVIAQGASANATVTVNGGQITTAANSDLNFNRGVGVLKVLGGLVDIGRNVNLGNNNAGSDAQIDLDAGTFSVGQDLSYRNNGVRDVVNVNGGEFIVTRNVNLANQSGGGGVNQFNHNGGTFRIRNGGTFNGDYQVGDDTATTAEFQVGDSPGLVNITGSFSLNSDAVIHLELGSDGAGSALAGTDYDKIIAGGAINLAAGSSASTVSLTTLTSLTDLSQDRSFSFVLLEGTSLTGEFGNLANGSQMSLGGVTVEAEYTATALNLIVVPEPSSSLLVALSIAALALRRRRRS